MKKPILVAAIILCSVGATGIAFWAVSLDRQAEELSAAHQEMKGLIRSSSEQIAETQKQVEGNRLQIADDEATERLALLARMKRVNGELESKKIVGDASEGELKQLEEEISSLESRLKELEEG